MFHKEEISSLAKIANKSRKNNSAAQKGGTAYSIQAIIITCSWHNC
jgi:hypothetical protein